MADNEKKPLTKEQAQVYEIIFAMAMKFILVIAGVVAFFIVLHFLITDKEFNNKLLYGALDSILAYTTYRLYKHYFPVAGDDKKKEPKVPKEPKAPKTPKP